MSRLEHFKERYLGRYEIVEVKESGEDILCIVSSLYSIACIPPYFMKLKVVVREIDNYIN